MSLAVSGTDSSLPVSNTEPSAVSDANSIGVSGNPAPAQAASVTVTNNPVSINPVLAKFGTAFLQIALVAITSITAIGNTAITPTILIQLGITVLGAVAVYLVPILNSAWRGLAKTGVAIITAALTAVIPFVTQGDISWQNWVIVGGAALTALATEVGVQVRTSTDANVS